jgi:hypothetical protein
MLPCSKLSLSFLCPELHAWFIAIGELAAGGFERNLHDLNSSPGRLSRFAQI